ncbi:hypothetical protein [Actinomadura sp. 6N118]|uniref:hypothetical protein n=1 Tax=Actinomadura sp. 6N118 TaxID=3375151 RepID=UPI0037A86864
MAAGLMGKSFAALRTGRLALPHADHAHARSSSRSVISASATPWGRLLARLRVTAGLGFRLGSEVSGGQG